MREIELTQGKVTLVDDADFDWLNQFNWFAHKDSRSDNYYAGRNSIGPNGKFHAVRMHRQILGLEPGDKRQGDHINHITLDNQRDNLRIGSHQQNMQNQLPNRNTTSQFKGVSWNKQSKKWCTQTIVSGKTKHLGYWEMEEVAALAYDIAATREFGEFANCNFN